MFLIQNLSMAGLCLLIACDPMTVEFKQPEKIASFTKEEEPTPPIEIDPIKPEAKATYENLRSKLLEQRCIGCHNAERHKGGVDLSSYAALKIGQSTTDPVLVKPGAPEDSLIYQAVTAPDSDDSPITRMPPAPHNERLSEAEVLLIKNWILEGAPEK